MSMKEKNTWVVIREKNNNDNFNNYKPHLYTSNAMLCQTCYVAAIWYTKTNHK